MPTSLQRAHEVLARHPLVDGHNDLPFALREAAAYDLDQIDISQRQSVTQTDLPRLREGGVGGQFWSVYVPGRWAGERAVTATFEQIDFVHRMVRHYPETLQLARTADEVERARAAGRIASLLGAEGGHSIDSSLAVLRAFHQLGVRYLTLTHNDNVPWADAATDVTRLGGLSAFGREVVREMNALGMLVDLSHVAPGTMRDALEATTAPVIFSHSSARALVDHVRNVPDEILTALTVNGGVCMVTFVPQFVSTAAHEWEHEMLIEMDARGENRRDWDQQQAAAAKRALTNPPPVVTVAQVADHVEHVREVAGLEFVGIGSDFDGCEPMPDGLGDVSCFPALFAELIERRWSEAELAAIARENVLRVLHDAEQRTRRVSEHPTSVLRDRNDEQRVTNAELFFDLVYVFAVTQLSHYLLNHATVEGALQTALLLGIVWLAWAYTTWVTNWLDPEQIPVRLMLLVTSLGSLVLSAALPQAFGSRGWAVAGAYAAMQIGRAIFVVCVVRGSLQRNYERILVWSIGSGVLALLGAGVHGHAREVLWLAAVLVDIGGGAVGFWAPGLGRSRTDEWTIEGGHFAERCQAFILIGLGESVVVIGQTLADVPSITARVITAFVTAFVGALGLWWIYFDRSADGAAEVIAASSDPGRLARSAYHLIHPVMVAGIIVTAAADELVLTHPSGHSSPATPWLLLGGTALFLAGHALFKWTVWRAVPWPRLVAIVVLMALVPVGRQGPALVLAFAALAVVLGVVAADTVQKRRVTEPAVRSGP